MGGVWLANDSRDAAGLAVLLGAEVDKVDGEAEDGHGRGLEVLRLLGVLLDDGDLGLLRAGRVRVDKGAHGGRKLGARHAVDRDVDVVARPPEELVAHPAARDAQHDRAPRERLRRRRQQHRKDALLVLRQRDRLPARLALTLLFLHAFSHSPPVKRSLSLFAKDVTE